MTLRARIRALLVPDADEQGLVASAPIVAVREIFRRFWPDAPPYRRQLVPVIEAAEIWMPAASSSILYECATGIALFVDEDDEAVEFPSLARAAHPVARDRRLPAALAHEIDAGLLKRPQARPSVAQLGAICVHAAGLAAAERRFGALTQRPR